MIVIDSAEKKNVQVERYLKANGVSTKREMLKFNDVECGDYTNTKRDFLVERKSWSDYISSVRDGSLISQCIRMCDNFKGPKYVAFEGDWDAMLESIQEPWVRSKAISTPFRLAHVYGIQFIKCIDALELAETLEWLDHYASTLTRDDDDLYLGVHGTKTKDIRIRPLFVIPRLGKTGAENLLKEYGNIMDVVEACGEDPSEVARTVPNVGKTTANLIYKTFYSDEPVDDRKMQSSGQSKIVKVNFAKQRDRYNTVRQYGTARNKKDNWR